MTTLKRTVIGALTSCALVLSGAGVAYGSTDTVTMQDRDSVSVTVESTTFERESEQTRAIPIAAIVAVLMAGYTVAYNDGVARAATGQVTWSMWSGDWGWGLMGAAYGLGPVGIAGYHGWSHGFQKECPNHSYCYYR